MNFEIKTIKYFHTIVNSGQFISRKFIEIMLGREKRLGITVTNLAMSLRYLKVINTCHQKIYWLKVSYLSQFFC